MKQDKLVQASHEKHGNKIILCKLEISVVTNCLVQKTFMLLHVSLPILPNKLPTLTVSHSHKAFPKVESKTISEKIKQNFWFAWLVKDLQTLSNWPGI